MIVEGLVLNCNSKVKIHAMNTSNATVFLKCRAHSRILECFRSITVKLITEIKKNN